MKALTLHQPYASLIAIGYKQYETRSRRTHYRGKLLITSAKKDTKQQREVWERISNHIGIETSWEALPKGKAILVCDLAGCWQMEPKSINKQREIELLVGNWIPGYWAYRLENAKAIADPFPVQGKQGFFNVNDSLLRDVL